MGWTNHEILFLIILSEYYGELLSHYFFFMQRAVFCTKRITRPKIPEVFFFFSIYKVVSLLKGAFLINLRFKCLI
ncbi:hypothetical protein C6349_15560 [Bacillus subtilis subsp. subtilis]|nr:hypothetical protein CDA59_20730 [Bacillus subtilis]AWX21917.1 hypothetical protein CXF51_10140 [Bacillus subtilis subsp. subtilis]EHA29432.1 hypothetical protein BSSC8_25290 [Bacillus subtilis subsp. subtilis str. SC-8]KAA0936862.1 hypothetical protein FQ086_04585 [Bacillus sp. ANT_WA51]RFB06587.1 hypothetical protein DZB72_06370 [Bacillus sp. MT]